MLLVVLIYFDDHGGHIGYTQGFPQCHGTPLPLPGK
jgi:hypothetical protein